MCYNCTSMELTLDTSALLAVLMGEPQAEQVLEHTRGAQLLAPSSLLLEVGNALAALVKRDKLDLETAKLALREALKVPFRAVNVDLEWSLILSSRYRIYAYDAYMLACAERYRTPLLTLDGRLRDVARSAGIEVLEVHA